MKGTRHSEEQIIMRHKVGDCRRSCSRAKRGVSRRIERAGGITRWWLILPHLASELRSEIPPPRLEPRKQLRE
jgi:hypothetical protein